MSTINHSAGLDTKIELEGTHRARTAEETWRTISAKLKDYDITRVAEVTHLDCIGIPVFVAVRPNAGSLAVSQGKGATPLLAKISAVMESIELWHAEQPNLVGYSCTTDVLRGLYPVSALGPRVDPEIIENLCFDWYTGRGIITGDRFPVPAALVRASTSVGHDWSPAIFHGSSTGLASGNTVAEATLHALYEVIERDVVSGLRVGRDDARKYFTPESIAAPHFRGFMDKLRAAGAEVEVAMVPNSYGIPTAISYVWSMEFPALCAGSGSHSDPVVAASRALSEAVQTRLTRITGTRDDIESDWNPFIFLPTSPNLETEGADWSTLLTDELLAEQSLSAEVNAVAQRVQAVTGYEPIVIDLSTDPSTFAVVKVICPGSGKFPRGWVPR